MRYLLSLLLCLWWAVRFGFECVRWNWRTFLRSFTLMPATLFTGREKSVARYASTIVASLKESPLDEKALLRFRQDPQMFAIWYAHKTTLPLWFAPLVRLGVMEQVYPEVQRFWTWKHGLTDADAAVSAFARSALPEG
jgi:hypothetical protein